MADIHKINEMIYEAKMAIEEHETKILSNIMRAMNLDDLDINKLKSIACSLRFDLGVNQLTIKRFLMSVVPLSLLSEWMSDDGRISYISWLRSLPYNEYLKTDHWQSVRHYCLCRDHFKCMVCNSENNLDVHHRTYERLGCEEIGDLATLCRDCHSLFHKNGKLVDPCQKSLNVAINV